MNLVKHVAIIMDGNGRWGIKNKNSRNKGHKQGLVTIEKIIKTTIKKKIKFLTLYAFSTENWKRPIKEIEFLFRLLENFLIKKTDELNSKDIKFKAIGSRKLLPKKLLKVIENSEHITKKNNLLQINLALNYGSKDEITSSIELIKKKKIAITQSNIERNLFTNDSPDPDLLIRTGKTRRLSNFLLWQLAYSEIYFVKKLWPDFTVRDYNNILKNFKNLKRNFGAIK